MEEPIALTSEQYRRLREILCSTCIFPTAWWKEGNDICIKTVYASWNSMHEENEEIEEKDIERAPYLAILSDENAKLYIDYQGVLQSRKSLTDLQFKLTKQKQMKADLTDRITTLAKETPLDIDEIARCTEMLRKNNSEGYENIIKETEERIIRDAHIEDQYKAVFMRSTITV